jgi:hypothetical protein
MGRIGSHRFLGNFHNSGQPDREGRAAARFALDRDVAPHHLAEAFADREAKPGAAVFAGCGCIGLGEFLEQLAHLLGRHADTGVGHSNHDPIATIAPLRLRGNGDCAVFCELVGIARQVEQRLPEACLVGMGRAEIRWAFAVAAAFVLRSSSPPF